MVVVPVTDSTLTMQSTAAFEFRPQRRRMSIWYSLRRSAHLKLAQPNVGASRGSGNEGRIYWDGQQIAYRAWDGTTYFEHQDWLGTERMRTNYTGAVAANFTSSRGASHRPRLEAPGGRTPPPSAGLRLRYRRLIGAPDVRLKPSTVIIPSPKGCGSLPIPTRPTI